VFQRYSEKNEHNEEVVPVTSVSCIFGDLAYICGTIFCYYKEFNESDN
jgi:hypothetical protein